MITRYEFFGKDKKLSPIPKNREEELELVTARVFFIQIKKAVLSKNPFDFLTLANSLTQYKGPLFRAFMLFFQELVERNAFNHIYRFQKILSDLDKKTPSTDEEKSRSPDFFAHLFVELLLQINTESGICLLGLIVKRYKSIALSSEPLLDLNSYGHFVQKIMYLLFNDLDQECAIDMLMDVALANKKIGPVLKDTFIGDLIYFWERSIGVMSDVHPNRLYFQQIPFVFKKKIQEDFIQLLKTTKDASVFAENIHFLYLVVTKYQSVHPDFEKILVDIHLILEVLREGRGAFLLFVEALLNEGADYSAHSIEVIRRQVQLDLWEVDQEELLRSLAPSPPTPESSLIPENKKKESLVVTPKAERLIVPLAFAPEESLDKIATVETRSSPIGFEEISGTPSASTLSLDVSSPQTSSLSAESPSFITSMFSSNRLDSTLLGILMDAQQKFEAMRLKLKPLLVCLLSLSDSKNLALSAEHAHDLWQHMHQVNLWCRQITTDPLSVQHLEEGPLLKFQEKLMPENIISTFSPFMRDDLSLIIEQWNSEINNLALSLREVSQEDYSSQLKQNAQVFIEKLSACYFYERTLPIYKYLQDVFGALGRVEVFGAQLFMIKDKCDTDVRIVWGEKQATQDIVVASVLAALNKQDPRALYSLKVQQFHLVYDRALARVINIKVTAGPDNAYPIDISVFIDGYTETNHYVSHAAASLNLKNGLLRCGHDFFKHILNNELIIKGEASSHENLLSREMHILKFLIRAHFVPATYLGKQSLLKFGKDATRIYGILKKYGADLHGLKERYPLLEHALRNLIWRHFKEDEVTRAYLNRTANLIRFCEEIGCRLIAILGDQHFELGLGPKPLKLIELKLISDPVKAEDCQSLFFTLNPSLKSFLWLSAPIRQAFFGLFRGAEKSSLDEAHGLRL